MKKVILVGLTLQIYAVFMIFLYCAIYADTIFHEFGHLIVALTMPDVNVTNYAAGNSLSFLSFLTKNITFEFKLFNPFGDIQWGMIVIEVGDKTPRVLNQIILTTFAGPLMSLLVSIVITRLLLRDVFKNASVRGFLWISCMYVMASAIMNLIPFTSGDGTLLFNAINELYQQDANGIFVFTLACWIVLFGITTIISYKNYRKISKKKLMFAFMDANFSDKFDKVKRMGTKHV